MSLPTAWLFQDITNNSALKPTSEESHSLAHFVI